MIPYTANRLGISQLDRYLDVYEVSNSHSWSTSGSTTFSVPITADSRGRFFPTFITAVTTAKTGANTVSISYGITGAATAYTASISGFGTLGKIQNFTLAFVTASKTLAGGENLIITFSLGGTTASTVTVKSTIIGIRL